MASIILASTQNSFHYLGRYCLCHVAIENRHLKNFPRVDYMDPDSHCHMEELMNRKRLNGFGLIFFLSLPDSKDLEVLKELSVLESCCFILPNPSNKVQHLNKFEKFIIQLHSIHHPFEFILHNTHYMDFDILHLKTACRRYHRVGLIPEILYYPENGKCF